VNFSLLSCARNRVVRLFAVMLGALTMAQASTLLYVSNGTTLSSLNPANGNVLDTQTLSIGWLQAMTFSPTGVLYGLFAPDFGEARLGIIDPTDGTVSLLALGTSQSRPTGLAFDSSGNLFGLFGRYIHALDPGTGASFGSGAGCGVGGVRSLAFGGESSARVVGDGQTFQQVVLDGNCGASTGSSSGSGSFISVNPGFQAFTNSNGVSFAIDWGDDPNGIRLVTFDGATFSASPMFTEVGLLSDASSIAAFDTGAMVPEPGSIVLLGLGVCGMLLHRRYR
jgi:hypothetical protein